MPVAFQHQPAPAKCVGDETISAGFHVAPLNSQHLIGVREIPMFATTSLLETREHQLSAHRAVTHQAPIAQGFL
jgi:hypothetical protein